MIDNHKIKNIYYMLAYAYHHLQEDDSNFIALENFDNIHDLFAAILIISIGTLIKRGLHRDYIRSIDELSKIRGKINISESFKRSTQTKRKLICDYDDFSENSLHNQIIKYVVRLLLSVGNVKKGNKVKLRKLINYFINVKDIKIFEIRWDALRYNRNNTTYRLIMEICRLTIEGLLITTNKGKHKLASWLHDEKINRLFERFVLEYYKKHHPELCPNASFINWNLSEGIKSEFLPIMKSDIILHNKESIIIIDTKFLSKTMAYNTLYDKKTYISNNLYQIYSYVKNYDKNNTGDVAGILLYAKTDEKITPNDDFVIGGSKISLKTIDLNKRWHEITDQLDNICEINNTQKK